jgi:hypothetical protein
LPLSPASASLFGSAEVAVFFELPRPTPARANPPLVALAVLPTSLLLSKPAKAWLPAPVAVLLLLLLPLPITAPAMAPLSVPRAIALFPVPSPGGAPPLVPVE